MVPETSCEKATPVSAKAVRNGCVDVLIFLRPCQMCVGVLSTGNDLHIRYCNTKYLSFVRRFFSNGTLVNFPYPQSPNYIHAKVHTGILNAVDLSVIYCSLHAPSGTRIRLEMSSVKNPRVELLHHRWRHRLAVT